MRCTHLVTRDLSTVSYIPHERQAAGGDPTLYAHRAARHPWSFHLAAALTIMSSCRAGYRVTACVTCLTCVGMLTLFLAGRVLYHASQGEPH
jgi:hypothetical protein